MLLNNLYYLLKPILSRRLQLALRRANIKVQLQKNRNVWPINKSSGIPPSDWKGWPEGKKFAIVITHDVESVIGLNKCQCLAEVDLQYGVKSSFNIVPYKYRVPVTTIEWLQNEGFEIGVHDFNHDGKLYRSKKIFNKRALKINECINHWNAKGFRSASMHHNLDWIADLSIVYDSSTFDTDPFEPQPDGVNTIFPFWHQQRGTERGFVEIPYTLPQDFTLFVLMREKDCRIWKEKLKWIAENGGMATVIIHPDYINFNKNRANETNEYSYYLYTQFLDYVMTNYKDQFWNPLPYEVADLFKRQTFK